MLTPEQKKQIFDYIMQNDEQGKGCLLSNLGNYIKGTLQLDWRAEADAASRRHLAVWLNQQNPPQTLYADKTRIAFHPFSQLSKPVKRQASVPPVPRYAANHPRFSNLRKLIRNNMNRDGVIDLNYLQTLMLDPAYGFGRWQDNLSPNETSTKMPQWAEFHFGDEFVLQQDNTLWSLIHNKYLNRAKHSPYPLELDPACEESAQELAQLQAFAYFSPRVPITLRRQSGYSGQDTAYWRAITAQQIAYARRYPREYIVHDLQGPDGQRRMLMRLPHVKSTHSFPLYFVFEAYDPAPTPQAVAAGAPLWVLLGCYRAGGTTETGQWINQALQVRSDHYLTPGVLTAENLPDAVSVWRALLRNGCLNVKKWLAIQFICQLNAGFPAQPETALLLYRLYTRGKNLSPISAALSETVRNYLLSLTDLTPPLQQEVRSLSKTPASLLSALRQVPANEKSLSFYFMCAGSFAGNLPGDGEVLSRYIPIDAAGSCSEEDAEVILRAAYNRKHAGSSMALKNLPLGDYPELQKALLDRQCTNAWKYPPTACHRSICTLSSWAVEFGQEDYLLTNRALLDYFSASGCCSFVYLLSLMLLAGHVETAHRWLHVISLPPQTPCKSFFDECKAMSLANLKDYVSQPWVSAMLKQLLPDGDFPAYGNLVQNFVWPAGSDAASLDELRIRAAAVKKLMEIKPEDHSLGFVLFLICKQAAALCSTENYPDDFLSLLYFAEYRLYAKHLHIVGRGSDFLNRQPFYAQVCDLILLGCLLRKKGIFCAEIPEMTSAFCAELLRQAEDCLLQASTAPLKPQAERRLKKLQAEVEALRRTPPVDTLAFYRDKLAHLPDAQLGDVQRTILARVTGCWGGLLADGQTSQSDWLLRRMDWLQDPGPDGTFHSIGLLRSLLQHFMQLPEEAWPAYRTWFLKQLTDAPCEAAQRPFLQLCFLLVRVPHNDTEPFTDKPKNSLLKNRDLLIYPLEEAPLPHKLIQAELYHFTPEYEIEQDEENEGDQNVENEADQNGKKVWRGQAYRQLSKRVRLMNLISNDYHLALRIASNYFQDNSKESPFRDLESAYAYYHAIISSFSSFPGNRPQGFPRLPLVRADEHGDSTTSRAREYACHILGSIGRFRKEETYALALNAFLQLLCYGRPEDIPLYFAKIPSQCKTFLELLYPLLQAETFDEVENALLSVKQLNLKLLEYIAVRLAQHLFPDFGAELRNRADALWNSMDKPAFAEHYTFVPNDVLKIDKKHLPIPGTLYADAFVEEAKTVLKTVQGTGGILPEIGTADPAVLYHQEIAQTTFMPEAPNPRRLQLLHYIYDAVLKNPSAGELLPSKNLLCMELGFEILRWQRHFAADANIEQAHSANDTFLKLLSLYSMCTETEKRSVICQEFSGQMVSNMADLVGSYSQPRKLAALYKLNPGAFESMKYALQISAGFDTNIRSYIDEFYLQMNNLLSPQTFSDGFANSADRLAAWRDSCLGTPWENLFDQLRILLTPKNTPSSGLWDISTTLPDFTDIFSNDDLSLIDLAQLEWLG